MHCKICLGGIQTQGNVMCDFCTEEAFQIHQDASQIHQDCPICGKKVPKGMFLCAACEKERLEAMGQSGQLQEGPGFEPDDARD